MRRLLNTICGRTRVRPLAAVTRYSLARATCGPLELSFSSGSDNHDDMRAGRCAGSFSPIFNADAFLVPV